ncbi:MAG: outer membrane lipoprotein carrier protein LolA [Syntrophobacterales bacterium]|nr:MAG: outer membrane lipoprotein carrier protein LolA [Syntrophobacterales bacterium]
MIESFTNGYHWKKKFLVLCIIVALILPAAPSLAQSLSLDDLAGKIQATYERTEDFRADFVQEATIKSMGRTTREEGTVYLKKPERMLWDYTKPSMKKLVINPRKAWLYLPDDEIVYVQDAKNVLSSKMTIRFLTGIGRLKDDFNMALPADGPTDTEGNYVVILTPRGYEAGIKTLLLTVDKDTFHIAGCVFTDLYDNETRLTFRNTKFNTDPADELFEFTPPPGVKIYNVQGQ